MALLFIYLWKKIRLDVSCEFHVLQKIHRKYQVLFFSGKKRKRNNEKKKITIMKTVVCCSNDWRLKYLSS